MTSVAPVLTNKILSKVGTNATTRTLGAASLGGTSAATYELGGEPRTSEVRIEEVKKAGIMGAALGPLGVIAAPSIGLIASKVSKPLSNFSQRAQKDAIRLLDALKKYEAKGTGDVKKLQGYETAYRLRIGNMRAIFEVIDNMVVLQAGYRGNIYER